MSLRSISLDMDMGTVVRVDALLDRAAAEHGCHVPLAVESGSRAWGFPSPDSDYDCRFFFVRRVRGHLTPWVRRDVIEYPVDGGLDVNGWDLGKALRLMLKGNPGIIEWLSSPIVYRGDPWFREEFLRLAHRAANRDAVGQHYLHFGERQRRIFFADAANVRLKRLFFAVQPAAALRWLRQRPDAKVVPLHFPTLIAECDPPAEVARLMAQLVARKTVARDLGEGPLPPAVSAFMDEEFRLARDVFRAGRIQRGSDILEATQWFYRTAVEAFDRVVAPAEVLA